MYGSDIFRLPYRTLGARRCVAGKRPGRCSFQARGREEERTNRCFSEFGISPNTVRAVRGRNRREARVPPPAVQDNTGGLAEGAAACMDGGMSAGVTGWNVASSWA